MIKRIAISQRVAQNLTYPETRDALARDWPDWIASILPDAGLLPVPNRPESVASWWDAAHPDALILSGGNNWGEAPERDRTERKLLTAAQDSNVPVLAVCRGLHVVNICFGGTIHSDLASVAPENHVNNEHAINIDGAAIKDLAGGPTLTVNSFHNQGIHQDGLAEGFNIFARAKGNIVEGMVHQSMPILAIQWHPERPSPSHDFDRQLVLSAFSRGLFWTEKD